MNNNYYFYNISSLKNDNIDKTQNSIMNTKSFNGFPLEILPSMDATYVKKPDSSNTIVMMTIAIKVNVGFHTM